MRKRPIGADNEETVADGARNILSLASTTASPDPVPGDGARQLQPASLTVLAYSLAHAPLGSPVLVVVHCCAGTRRVASASLVPTLVAHLVWDALVLVWLPLDS